MPVTSPGKTENDMLLTIAPMRMFSTLQHRQRAEGAARPAANAGASFVKLLPDHVANEAGRGRNPRPGR